MSRYGYVDVGELIDYANNHKDKTIDANDIARFPIADVVPVVHAHWVPFNSSAAGDIQYCSRCDIGYAEKTDYCPRCGAKMDESVKNATT